MERKCIDLVINAGSQLVNSSNDQPRIFASFPHIHDLHVWFRFS